MSCWEESSSTKWPIPIAWQRSERQAMLIAPRMLRFRLECVPVPYCQWTLWKSRSHPWSNDGRPDIPLKDLRTRSSLMLIAEYGAPSSTNGSHIHVKEYIWDRWDKIKGAFKWAIPKSRTIAEPEAPFLWEVLGWITISQRQRDIGITEYQCLARWKSIHDCAVAELIISRWRNSFQSVQQGIKLAWRGCSRDILCFLDWPLDGL